MEDFLEPREAASASIRWNAVSIDIAPNPELESPGALIYTLTVPVDHDNLIYDLPTGLWTLVDDGIRDVAREALGEGSAVYARNGMLTLVVDAEMAATFADAPDDVVDVINSFVDECAIEIKSLSSQLQENLRARGVRA